MEANNSKSFLEEHFAYEVKMLCVSLEGIILSIQQGNIWMKNLAIENFLLHFRNLVEFLYFEKKYDDDARSKEFINAANWSLLYKSYTKESKKLYFRACKEVDHLTYSRFYGTPPEKAWDCPKMFNLIIRDVKNFLNYLPENLQIDNDIRVDLEKRINKFNFTATSPNTG